MSRETQREMDEERRDERPAAPSPRQRKQRTGLRQFLREVRQELKRVAWPSRKELVSYSAVVLVAVTLVTVYVFGLDQAFGQLVFWIFR
ncbi:MAG TPA: preprotein translocase subunit SecE [Egibacteraceae bacterium]|nr:preprotein translocase subunit SecE [Egibacteraceae bacterium]